MVDPLDYLRGDVKEDSIGEKVYRGILIYGTSRELQQEAQRLADALGVNVESVDNRIEEAIKTKSPEIVLFEESDETLELAARLAQRLKLGLVTGCVKLEVEHAKRLILMHRPIYGGKEMEVCVCRTKPQMATIK